MRARPSARLLIVARGPRVLLFRFVHESGTCWLFGSIWTDLERELVAAGKI